MGDDEATSNLAEIGGTLHDCGKCRPDILIQTRIAGRPDRFDLIQEHPVVGADMVRSEFGDDVANVVLHHHWKYPNVWPDGQGRTLADLDLATRRVAAADIFQSVAMDTGRAYRQPSLRDAVKFLRGDGFTSEEIEMLIRQNGFTEPFRREY